MKELMLMMLEFLEALVVIPLGVAIIVIWVYVMSTTTYRICEKIGEYIERKFSKWR